MMSNESQDEVMSALLAIMALRKKARKSITNSLRNLNDATNYMIDIEQQVARIEVRLRQTE